MYDGSSKGFKNKVSIIPPPPNITSYELHYIKGFKINLTWPIYALEYTQIPSKPMIYCHNHKKHLTYSWSYASAPEMISNDDGHNLYKVVGEVYLGTKTLIYHGYEYINSWHIHTMTATII